METALSTLAQVFVGPLVGIIVDYYGPAILAEIGIKWDVTEEMEKLSDNLLLIQKVLEDAEDKQTTSKPIRNWLRKLKDVAYDVEDLLDECATEALHEPESTGSINCAAIVDIIKRFFMNNFEEIAEQRSMTKRIKLLINKFEEIAKQSSNFDLINNRSSTSTTRVVNYTVDPRRETSSFPTELKVYGRDEEKECIVNLMVNNINAGNLSIYAIVGIGGLGKTTLAQMVYNDSMVKSRFEIKRWICVSENFEPKSLIGDIIQSGSNNNSQTLDQLQHRLQKILSGKRFLLVLDDVWNEDEAKWERLKSSLLCGAKGSSIIVTTRSDKVASLMAGSSHDHVCHPKMLSEEDCFSLFKHRAFAEGEGEHHPNLESIGKEIVEKLWLFVKESKLWDLPQDKEDSILPALRLSYNHLPPHLRQCFAYCSIFPKDYKINKEVLIQLWMANGFLQPEGNMELEDIGNVIFNDLLWRGFFQEVSVDHLHIIECKMHDLVHDLACSITRDECFSVVTDADIELVAGRRNTTRHLAIYHRILFSTNFSLSLRTFFKLDIGMHHPLAPPPLNLSNLIYLRVLDLRSTTVGNIEVKSIARLKLLRYLDLSGTRITILSDEVFCNLINLQTLKLIYCNNLEMLPGNMSKLTNLRHLDITGSTGKLLGVPAGMGKLKSLHMLSHFIVSEESGCGVGELGELDHLGGSLKISELWKVKDVRDAENAKLSRKENIRVLGLNWSNWMNDDDKLIADALQPHHNLEGLVFSNYGGCDFPSWLNSTYLFSLVTLEIFYFYVCKHLPTLGLLPHLKKLYLKGIPVVECIGNEFYCDEEEGNNMMKAARFMVLFPALENLELDEMPSLEEWKGWSSSSRMKEGEAQVSVFPVLESLRIQDFPNLTALPDDFQNVNALETLEITYCPKLVSLPVIIALNLQLLVIANCDGLKSLNNCLQLLTNLHNLRIIDCGELELLPNDFQNLKAIQILEIVGCTSLVGLPEMHNLTSLKKLEIERCDGLKSLNKCLQHLTNLHELKINFCRELELLPDDFQNLVSLQSLYLYNCENLKSLPEGLQHLTALQCLQITGCHPELHRRCQKNTGEDWHKIAHIPRLFTQ